MGSITQFVIGIDGRKDALAEKPIAVGVHPAVVEAALRHEHMVGQVVQAVGVIAVAAAEAAEYHVAVFVQHVAQRAAVAEGVGNAAIQRTALWGGGEVVQGVVFALQMGQVGDKALGAVDAGGGGLVVVVVPQLQPDIAVARAVHHHALLVLHRLHGGICDDLAGVGVADFQAAVFGIESNGVVRDTAGVQRRYIAGLKVVQVIAVITGGAPGDHRTREIMAGHVLKGADDPAVLGGHVPQLVPAIVGDKARRAVAAGLGVARKTFTGGGIIKHLVHRCTVGVVGIQFHPVGQLIGRIGNAVSGGGVGSIHLRAVFRQNDDPAVQGGVIVPFVVGKVGRAGVAGIDEAVTAHDAGVCALRYGQAFAGGRVDDLTGAIAAVAVLIFAVDQPAFLQHQQAVLQGGTLFAVKGQHFSAVLIIEGAAASAPAGGVRPAAEPVIRLAGDDILQKGYIFTAGRLVQHLAAAEDGGAAAGTVVAVERPQLAVVQPGGVVQRLAA